MKITIYLNNYNTQTQETLKLLCKCLTLPLACGTSHLHIAAFIRSVNVVTMYCLLEKYAVNPCVIAIVYGPIFFQHSYVYWYGAWNNINICIICSLETNYILTNEQMLYNYDKTSKQLFVFMIWWIVNLWAYSLLSTYWILLQSLTNIFLLWTLAPYSYKVYLFSQVIANCGYNVIKSKSMIGSYH